MTPWSIMGRHGPSRGLACGGTSVAGQTDCSVVVIVAVGVVIAVIVVVTIGACDVAGLGVDADVGAVGGAVGVDPDLPVERAVVLVELRVVDRARCPLESGL